MSALATSSYTYTGVWINWSHGAIRGATLTLSKRYGGYLTAFLALYVTVAGGMFWKILSYTLHQIHTTPPGTTRDGLHHQRQVILRNSKGAGDAFLSFVRLPLSWRDRATKPFIRSLPFAILAALNLGLFGFATIFSSAISSSPGNSTLIMGHACGGYSTKSFTSPLGASWYSKLLTDTYDAATYVRQCYTNTTSLGCGLYYRQNLPFSVNPNATCPFASGVCVYNDHSAFAMDTGLLDSHADLGINAPPQNRVLFRRVTTCAPLHAKQWATTQNDSEVGLVIYINAGPNPPSNYTFSYYHRAGADGFGYSLTAADAISGFSSNSTWKPDALLNRTDADITLMMLNQNTISYQAVSDDPWMPAHVPVDAQNSSYMGDYDLNLLGCAEQHQICNPNTVDGAIKCTQLSGGFQVQLELASTGNTVGLNVYQQYAVNRILSHAFLMNMFNAVFGRGAAALNANERTFADSQTPILSTQWQTEVSLWFSLCLAKLQYYMIEWATKPTHIDPPPQFDITSTLNTPYETVMCTNQLIHSTSSHQSFSILGLSLIIALGGIIILGGIFVDTIGGWVEGSLRRGWRDIQWRSEETLQLHRGAYGAAGMKGIWEESLDAVPRTIQRNVQMPPSSELWGVTIGQSKGYEPVETIVQGTILL